LDEIYDYIVFREKSTSPAQKLIDRIFEKTDQLSEYPESGQPEPLLVEIGQDSRYLVEASYKIIFEYNPLKELVVIIDVFHTSQNPIKIERSSKKK
jgi:plasmid stabilization system protein ParE